EDGIRDYKVTGVQTCALPISPRLDLPPLTIVPMTPPIEATLRILLNSVPYLIGAAVVRQPAVGDSVEAQVGRMPWLHDRRLLNRSEERRVGKEGSCGGGREHE